MSNRSPFQTWLWLSVVLVALLACGPLDLIADTFDRRTEWYVSTAGSDSNDCRTEATACASVNEAFSRSEAGNTIHIGAGTFPVDYMVARHDLFLLGAGMDETILDIGEDSFLNVATPLESLTGIEVAVAELTVHNGVLAVDVAASSQATFTNVRFTGQTAWPNYGVLNNRGSLELLSTEIEAIDLDSSCFFTDYDYGGTGNPATTIAGGVIVNMGSLRIQGSQIQGADNLEAICNLRGGTATVVDSEISGFYKAILSSEAAVGVSRTRFYRTAYRAIEVFDGELTVIGSEFTDGQGGAWTLANEHRGDAIYTTGDTNVDQSNFDNAGVQGVLASGPGSLTIANSTFQHYLAALDLTEGMAHISNSTFSGNHIGISLDAASVQLDNVTVTANEFGIVRFDPGPATARNSIVARNSILDCDQGDSFPLNLRSLGHNLDGDGSCGFGEPTDLGARSPGLLPLADNGGPTLTHALEATGAAFDAGSCTDTSGATVTMDQRGEVRPGGADCDIGAFELTFELLSLGGEISLATVTPTVEAGIPIATFIQNANCRSGPGTVYPVRRSFLQGDAFELDGRNANGSWFYNAEHDCWVSQVTIEVPGVLSELPVLPAPPTPTFTPPPATATPVGPPAAPSNLTISEICSQTEYTITLHWQDNAANEDGYRVYYNGNLIATLGPNATSYEYAVPSDFSATYSVESFNDAGSSNQATVNEDGCLV